MTHDVINAARRRTRRRVGAVTLAGLAVAGLVYPAGLYVNAHLDPRDPAAAPSVGPWPAVTVGVGLLPPDVVWVPVAGVDLPTSPATGPAHSRGGLARGFAHARAGAVVAALHL